MKEIYLATTEGCESCNIMSKILRKILNEQKNFILHIQDFNNLPDWIKVNVPLNDFPTTIIVIDNVIKYHFQGTRPLFNVYEILNSLNFLNYESI